MNKIERFFFLKLNEKYNRNVEIRSKYNNDNNNNLHIVIFKVVRMGYHIVGSCRPLFRFMVSTCF